MTYIYLTWQYLKKPEEKKPFVSLKNVYKKENGAIIKCIIANHKEGDEFIKIYRRKKKSDKVDSDIVVFNKAWDVFGSANPYEMEVKDLDMIHNTIIKCVISFALYFGYSYKLLHYEEKEMVD